MTARPSSLTIGPFYRAAGAVKLPGSKSISNRTLLLAALAHGTTVVRNLLRSDDTQVMLAALTELGVSVVQLDEDEYAIKGCNGDFPVHEATLFLGNAGTAFRPLTAALALQQGSRRYALSGVARMHERPIGDLVDGLTAMGANVAYAGNSGFPPLIIGGGHFKNTRAVQIRGDVSSQFLSALLMAAPLLRQPMVIDVVGELISKPYVEITLNLMTQFGVAVSRQDWQRFEITPTHEVPGAADAADVTRAPYAAYRSPGTIAVEGDASSASYFLAAGAIGASQAAPVRVLGAGRTSIQGDVKFADVLSGMGATVLMGDDWISAAPPPNGKLQAIDADLNHIPDAAMTIAVLALFAEGTTTIRNVASWRVKETDRLAAMAIELRKVGALVEEGVDSIRITPPASGPTPNAQIDTYDDHRMAMCFSLVSLGGVPVTINDPGCVAKTFPTYFDVFQGIAT
jgi:3-phosphoshikimate 1-carboxyvinyltransferase